MAQNNKQKKRKRNPNAALKAPAGAPAVLPPPVVSTGDARRDSLMRQIDTAQQALDRESKSGFGDRSKNAADHLARLNKELKEYDSSQNVGERAYKLAVNVGAPVLGMVAGHKIAQSLSAKHTTAVQSRNKELQKLAQKSDRILAKPRVTPAAKNRLRSIVKSAEHLGLDKIKGPLGGVTAGLLIAEGLYSRMVLAPQVDNEYAKEALRSVGTASVFAATSLIGERVIANATQKTLPNSAHLASINEARLATEKTPRAGTKAHKLAVQASKGSLASRSLRLIGRVATPVVVGVAAAAAFTQSARAGETTAVSTTKGGVAALDTLAMNVPSSANAALKERGHGSVPEFISNTLLKSFGQRKPAAPTPVATRQLAPIKAATGNSSPITKIASAGRAQSASRVTTTRVDAHFKSQHGKGVFTRAHVRAVAR